MNILQHDGCEPEQTEDVSKKYNTARNFTGTTINLLTFNNGFHTIHHMFPTMHWSELRKQHNQKIKQHIHPNLDQPCMASYIFRTFIFPGHRVNYLGGPVRFTIDVKERDQDWTHEHAPEEFKLVEYDCTSLRRIVGKHDWFYALHFSTWSQACFESCVFNRPLIMINLYDSSTVSTVFFAL